MPSGTPRTAPNQEEVIWAVLSHAVALVCSSFLLGFVVPIVALMCNGNSAFVRAHAKASLNFQLNLLLWLAISFVLCFVVVGFFLLAVVAIFAFILPIIASINAASGNLYEYPFTIKFIRNREAA
jgi:hypothetical protein